MGIAAEEAKRYLHLKEVPQLFESMMTGLMYNKPEDPIEFMLRSLHSIRNQPDKKVTWDMFIDNVPPPIHMNGEGEEGNRPPSRPPSAIVNAKKAKIPHVPVILLIGGPGGGKTRHAKRVAEHFASQRLVHISVPQLIRVALVKYKDKYPQWGAADKQYEAGELISSDLVLALVKSEMGSKQGAKGFFLEGYPRSKEQIVDFEKEIKRVDMALILDYDEAALKEQMEYNNLEGDLIEKRLHEFKTKTLPAAKYFDDKYLLHLVPGEQEDDNIFEEMKSHVQAALNGPAGKTSSDEVPKGLPNDSPVVIIVGAPGSQKSEYCSRIVKRYDGFVHISVGNLLREKLKSDPKEPQLKKALETMNAGGMLPTELVRDLLYKEIHKHPKSWGFVIEGYPRTAEQAQDFEKTVDRVDLVLLIDCTEQFCLNTLRERSESGEGRPDDTLETVKERLAAFKVSTLPMLKYFDEKGKLKVVEGDEGIETIFQEVVNVIDAALFIPQENGSGKSLDSSKNS